MTIYNIYQAILGFLANMNAVKPVTLPALKYNLVLNTTRTSESVTNPLYYSTLPQV